jgi:hypothetical protein
VRAAIRRHARGEPARLPPWLLIHLVAARYGQTPASVREWPADDYLDALNALPITGGQRE